MAPAHYYRTWVEINRAAALHNAGVFRSLIPKTTKLMAVVKSNAYGHGILDFPKDIRSKIDWFGVDSITEGLRLRKEGIKKPILVLGATLESRFRDAARQGITLTISNFEGLKAVLKQKRPPMFHLKIDTGMHRQGFQPHEIKKLLGEILNSKSYILNSLHGIYTHFAKAKTKKLDDFTQKQFAAFTRAADMFQSAGFADLVRHSAATAGTLLYSDSHLDMVRIGIGLYGLFPSKDVAAARRNVVLHPVLAWRTRIAEVKRISRGEGIGYDLTRRVARPSTIAVLPIGYWHGLDRGLSNNGFVLVRGKRAPITGRVSMDMAVVDVTDIPGVKAGDVATVIGKDRGERITAEEIAARLDTINYEVLTRINPLIERVVL